MKFEEKAEKLGISLSDRQLQQFEEYYRMLVDWNKRMNLTAITDYDEVVVKHFIDSLAIVKAVDVREIATMIDVGTGAGFPGIPLKIAYPHLKVTLVDALAKRVAFLEVVAETLHLEDVKILHGRAEDFAKTEKYRERFDLGVSRAVGALPVLSEYLIPYIRVGGIFIAYKTGTVDEEIQHAEHAIEVLGGEVEDPVKFTLENGLISRSFVRIYKKNPTPSKYPRKAGVPVKKPLL